MDGYRRKGNDSKGRRSHMEDVPAAKLDNVSNRMNSVVKTPKGKAVGALDTNASA